MVFYQITWRLAMCELRFVEINMNQCDMMLVDLVDL